MRQVSFRTFTCERCAAVFERPWRDYRFCSQACANAAKFRVDLDLVKRLALLGTKLEELGKQAGIHPRTARKVIDQLGVYREWSQVRYLKCRSFHG